MRSFITTISNMSSLNQISLYVYQSLYRIMFNGLFMISCYVQEKPAPTFFDKAPSFEAHRYLNNRLGIFCARGGGLLDHPYAPTLQLFYLFYFPFCYMTFKLCFSPFLSLFSSTPFIIYMPTNYSNRI